MIGMQYVNGVSSEGPLEVSSYCILGSGPVPLMQSFKCRKATRLYHVQTAIQAPKVIMEEARSQTYIWLVNETGDGTNLEPWTFSTI